MNFVASTLRNFRALTGPHTIPLRDLGVVHVLGENKVSSAADSNGSCKSSLVISGVCWTLFGRTEAVKEIGGERVRNRFTDESVVGEVEYENEEGRFHLTRERAKGGSDKVRLVGPHGKIYDAKHEVERQLGFDWGFFTNIVVFGPDTNARFTRAGDADRKSVLDQIVPDLERLNGVFARADSQAKAAAKLLEAGDVKAGSLREKIESFERVQEDVERLRADLSGRKFEQWRDVMRAQQELNEERIRVYEEVVRRLLINERMAAVAPLLTRHREADAHREELHEQVIVQEERCAGLESNLTARQREAEKLLTKGVCPTCSQKFSRKVAKEIVERARMQDLPTRTRLTAERSALVKMRQKMDGYARICGELNYVLALHSELDLEDRDTEMLDELERQLSDSLARLRRLERDELRPMATTVPDGLVPIEQARGDLRRLEDSLASLKVRAGDLSFWLDALGKGIKSRLLSGVEDFLDERLRRYSGRLTAGESTIGFSSRTTLRSGEGRARVSLTAESMFGAGELDLHSSGERQRIDLAVILALQDLARRQRGCDVRLSLFDEVFDHLDESGAERLMSLLVDEKRERGTIMIVTQSPRLASMPADHQLVVRRATAGTTVLFDGDEV